MLQVTLLVLPKSLRRDEGHGFELGVKPWKFFEPSGFSSVYAICKELGTFWILVFLEISRSQMKWISSSICFVRACRIGSCDNSTTLRLSHKRVRERKHIEISLKSDSNQSSLEVLCAKARYSTYMLNLTTNSHFLEIQDTKLGPKKMKDPGVDLWSSGSLAQSESL